MITQQLSTCAKLVVVLFHSFELLHIIFYDIAILGCPQYLVKPSLGVHFNRCCTFHFISWGLPFTKDGKTDWFAHQAQSYSNGYFIYIYTYIYPLLVKQHLYIQTGPWYDDEACPMHFAENCYSKSCQTIRILILLFANNIFNAFNP